MKSLRFVLMLLSCVIVLPLVMIPPRVVIADDGSERPKCDTCKGTGSVACVFCRGTGKVAGKTAGERVPCRTCSGKGTVKCYLCRGTGKKLILQDVIPKERWAACGISKLSVAEQEALSRETFRLYYDPWGEGAAKHMESEGWTKATITKIRKNGIKVETDDGEELTLDDSLPILSPSVGDAIWLESTVGLTDVIDAEGESYSYEVK